MRDNFEAASNTVRVRRNLRTETVTADRTKTASRQDTGNISGRMGASLKGTSKTA